jgi:hypothetical protein
LDRRSCFVAIRGSGKRGYLLAGPEISQQAMRQTEAFLKSLKPLGIAARQPVKA